jgi:hypothetical protein
MKKLSLLYCIVFCCTAFLFGQGYEETDVKINGRVMTAMILDGDTIILAELEDVSITAPRSFGTVEEYQKYLRYRKYANTVYQYAVEAIKIFREMEYATRDMNKRQRKKYNKRLQKELKEEFEEPLKKLSRTQGLILTKMIERELDTPIHSLVKDLRGVVTATYWNQFGKFYGYRLKDKYQKGEDLILDAVLEDYDISYNISKK